MHLLVVLKSTRSIDFLHFPCLNIFFFFSVTLMSIYDNVLVFRLCHYAYFCFECPDVIAYLFLNMDEKKEENSC